MRKKNLTIVGNGMATCRLLDELTSRGAEERYDVQVIGDEPGGAYNRIMLSKVLEGNEPESVVTKPPEWYAERGIRLLSSTRALRLSPRERRIETDVAGSLRYDVAVIATGSQPLVPRIEGLHGPEGEPLPGVFVYRTLNDCLSMRAYARPGDNVVVLGGGLLGLEAGKVLSDLGLHVTVVHLAHGLMNTQLDFVGGTMLQRHIERCGMFVRTGRTIEQVLGADRLEGVVLDDGEHLSADMLVVACGVRPRVELARDSNIPVNKGIMVNDTLATQVPGVYALGECSEHAGTTFGLVAPAWEQAVVLADLLCGTKPQARYRGSKLYARLKVAGVEVASLGGLEPVLDSDQVVQVVEERKSAYRKLIVRDRKLIGAMLVGDTRAAPALIQAFDRDDLLPEDPLEALCSFGAGGASSAARQVCNCHKVTEAAIVAAIGEGATTQELVTEQTRAGSGCGSCKSEIEQLVTLHAKPLAESA